MHCDTWLKISKRSKGAYLSNEIEFQVFPIYLVGVEPNDVFVDDIIEVMVLIDQGLGMSQCLRFVIIDVNLIPNNFNTFY